MTVYQEHRTWNPADDEVECAIDPMPDGLWRVWELDDGELWVRNGDVWTAPSMGGESLELSWEELLQDFGPVTDDEEEVQGCPICGVGGCAGHTRKPSDVLTSAGGAKEER